MRAVVKFIKDNALLVIGVLILIFLLLNHFKIVLGGLFNQGLNYNNLDSSKSNLSDTQARALAEQLHKSMTTWRGTDEDSIYRIFMGLSVDDFNKIYNFFGVRPYMELFGVATTEYLGENIDLFGWLKYELTYSEYKKLESLNPDVFSLNKKN